jgi:hypothetical protein
LAEGYIYAEIDVSRGGGTHIWTEAPGAARTFDTWAGVKRT